MPKARPSSAPTAASEATPCHSGSPPSSTQTHSATPQTTSDADIDQYLHDQTAGFGPGIPCPANGSSISFVEVAPGLSSPRRSLNTLGVFYMLEGEVKLVLDGGEEKALKKGDCGVLRGAAHSWRNESSERAKLIAFSQGLGTRE